MYIHVNIFKIYTVCVLFIYTFVNDKIEMQNDMMSYILHSLRHGIFLFAYTSFLINKQLIRL